MQDLQHEIRTTMAGVGTGGRNYLREAELVTYLGRCTNFGRFKA